jgi:hypothetical protein
MTTLKSGEKRKVIATGTVGLIVRVSQSIEEQNINYYHLADAEADKLDVYISLGRFKIEELDYTDNQKEDMWHESEEHGRQVNEENYYHYYNR